MHLAASREAEKEGWMVHRIVSLGWAKPRGGLFLEAKERRGDQWESWGLTQCGAWRRAQTRLERWPP